MKFQFRFVLTSVCKNEPDYFVNKFDFIQRENDAESGSAGVIDPEWIQFELVISNRVKRIPLTVNGGKLLSSF